MGSSLRVDTVDAERMGGGCTHCTDNAQAPAADMPRKIHRDNLLIKARSPF
jgi:hypothetical protein